MHIDLLKDDIQSDLLVKWTLCNTICSKPKSSFKAYDKNRHPLASNQPLLGIFTKCSEGKCIIFSIIAVGIVWEVDERCYYLALRYSEDNIKRLWLFIYQRYNNCFFFNYPFSSLRTTVIASHHHKDRFLFFC